MLSLPANVSAKLLSGGDRARAPRRGMGISDAHGGTLWLDLSRPELRWLARGCRSLIAGTVPPGASMLKVDVGSTVYLLNYRFDAAGEAELQITDLYDPTQRVVLLRDLAQMIAALVEQFAETESAATDRRVDG